MDAYRKSVRRFVLLLYKYKMGYVGLVLGTLFTEPYLAIRSGLFFVLGRKKKFHFHRLNPSVLNEVQKNYTPILLLHGNLNNQSLWLDLGKWLARYHLGPVYTVNLPSGRITKKDIEIINRKLVSIKGHYQKKGAQSTSVILIGHSRGGKIISQLLARPDLIAIDISKAILIGAFLESSKGSIEQGFLIDRVYEIISAQDIILGDQTEYLLPQNQRLILNEGHLGIVFSNKTKQHIIKWLS